MNPLDDLARTDIAPALLAQVQALFAQQQAKLAEKDFKITALTHELAYYRRIRFGKASEALVGEQSLLFVVESKFVCNATANLSARSSLSNFSENLPRNQILRELKVNLSAKFLRKANLSAIFPLHRVASERRGPLKNTSSG